MKPFVLLVGLIVLIMLLPALALLFRRKPSEPPTPAGSAPRKPKAPTIVSNKPLIGVIPEDFPVNAFLAGARDAYMQLQAAQDCGDLDAIRARTTVEMYADIARQLQARGNAPRRTEVLALNSDLLEVVTGNGSSVASVRMSGQLRTGGGAVQSFDEVWHLQQDSDNARAAWLLAGIRPAS